MNNEIYLSVIISLYKESKRLPNSLPKIFEYLKKQSYNYEILLVNDGSPDNTYEIAKSLESKFKNVKVIGHKANPEYTQNMGKGYGVRFGMLKAKGKYRIFMDIDNSTPIKEVEKMWPEFENGFDIVIGSRDIKGAILDPPQPFQRVLVGNIFNLIVQATVGLWGIWDTQCGFKGFTKKATETIFPKCKINRFAFDPELLIIGRKLGYKMKEIPVYWKNDLRSTVKFSSMFEMLKDLLRIRANMIAGKYD